MTHSHTHFHDTYSKTLLNDWKTLLKIIEGSEAQHLNPENLDHALNGPLGPFFLSFIQAYLKIMQQHHAQALKNDEAFKDLASTNLPTKSPTEIDQEMAELNESFEKNYQLWLNFWLESAKNLAKKLAEKKLILNPIETEDLYRQENLIVLYKRFNELQVEIPTLKSPSMNLSNYLYLKTYLAIQSALSRQHLPHEPSDIEGFLKLLKKDFQSIAQAEKELL